MYIYRHAFQRVVSPCRGKRTGPAESQPDCQWKVATSWLLPWEVPSWTSHSSTREFPTFHWRSQAMIVLGKSSAPCVA